MLAVTEPINAHGMAILLLDSFVALVFVLKPITRSYDDSDRGSGPVVMMVPPLRPSYRRCGLFMAVSFISSAVILGLKTPNLNSGYQHLVAQILQSVINDPLTVSSYTHLLPTIFQVSILSFGLAFAIAFRASLARRLMILFNCVLYLAVSAIAEAWIGILELETHIPLGPKPVVNLIVEYVIAGVSLLRIGYTSFQLPKKTRLAIRRDPDWINDLILLCCFAASLTLVGSACSYLIAHYGQDPLVSLAIIYACGPYLLAFIYVFLGIVRLVSHRPARPGENRPLVEVIIPAFNEEINIATLLKSLDAAAVRYEGPVRVILCDDGSTDSTVTLAQAAMDNFRQATGEIIFGEHRGKSAALNRALGICRADIVIRIDADCTIHEEAILYTVPNFLRDPKVGMVSAFTLPKEPYTTWIDRMRFFEMIVSYGYARPALDVADLIWCVPGTFTAFLRGPALEIGGFVEGMYGEDVDFTYSMARLGYRVVVDNRIRSFEDVPNTQRQLRVQRTRWNRGGTMSYSRFVPIVTGFAGPRMWFVATRLAVRRFLTPLHISILLYAIALAIFHPSDEVNLARLGFIILFRPLPQVIQTVILSCYYRRGRHLVWFPVRYVFVLLKHYYTLECFLSFNARPVITDRVAAALRLRSYPPMTLDSPEVA